MAVIASGVAFLELQPCPAEFEAAIAFRWLPPATVQHQSSNPALPRILLNRPYPRSSCGSAAGDPAALLAALHGAAVGELLDSTGHGREGLRAEFSKVLE